MCHIFLGVLSRPASLSKWFTVKNWAYSAPWTLWYWRLFGSPWFPGLHAVMIREPCGIRNWTGVSFMQNLCLDFYTIYLCPGSIILILEGVFFLEHRKILSILRLRYPFPFDLCIPYLRQSDINLSPYQPSEEWRISAL